MKPVSTLHQDSISINSLRELKCTDICQKHRLDICILLKELLQFEIVSFICTQHEHAFPDIDSTYILCQLDAMRKYKQRVLFVAFIPSWPFSAL